MNNKIFDNLSGKMLIASPYALYNDMFSKSLIYMLSHNKHGASGVIINHLMSRVPLKSILHEQAKDNITLGNSLLPIYLGGPVELEKGFFLHSDEYDKNLLFKFQNNLAISSNTSILEDIANGSGPKQSLFMVGYTGWEAGQLEFELENNFWIVADSDSELIFSTANDKKWHIALQNLGIEDVYFTSRFGSC